MAEAQFPTMAEVEKASKNQLAYWYRFLLATNAEERKTLRRISQRLKEFGGMTPELSKKVGYGGV